VSKETDDLLHHPDVLAVIRAVLRMTGMRSDLLEDGVQEVLTRAWAATAGDRPDTIDRWKKICRPIAKKYGIDELRKRTARQKRNVGLIGNPEDYASEKYVRPRWDERDARKALDLLSMMLDEGVLPRDFETYLDAIQAGEPYDKIAREAGLSDVAFRKQLFRARKRFGTRLALSGLGGLAVIGAIVLGYPYVDPHAVAHHPGPATSADAGPAGARNAPPPSIMVDTHEPEIAALRAKAEAAAEAKNWRECATAFYDIAKLRREAAIAMDAAVPVSPPDALEATCDENFARSLNSKGGPAPKK
jgi:RNA polymerase sigma factor (sigma-70 family)